VEKREICTPAARRQKVDLGPHATRESPSDTTGGAWDGAGIHRLTS
jgi:hypothetical protein